MVTARGRVRGLDQRSAVLVTVCVAVLACVIVVATNPGSGQVLLLGTGAGSLIAALALGIVVTYQGSGVVNIATGAMAMHASYVFAVLTGQGKLLVLGWTVPVGDPWPFVPALLLTALMSGLLGLAAYFLVFAPMRHASAVAKLVASVGLLLVLQAIIQLKFGSTALLVASSMTDRTLDLPGEIILPANQAVMVGIVLVATAALWCIYRFTRFGIATRAAAEDEAKLSTVGRSARVVSGGNWFFSGIVVGLLAVFAASINGAVDPTSTTMLVIPALAAALLGGFKSFPVAALGGLAIGMTQALMVFLSSATWFPQVQGQSIPGVADCVPLVLILVTLSFRRSGVGSRGSFGDMRLPRSSVPRFVPAYLTVGTVLSVVGFMTLSSPWRLAELNTLIGVLFCLSLVVLTGFVGQVSLAQMALAGISGFTLAKLGNDAGIGFPLAPLLGAMGATVVGVLAAMPALKARGVQLAVVTLAASVAIENFVFQNPLWSGGFGGVTVPSPSLFGIDFGPSAPSRLGEGNLPNPWFGIFCTVIVVLSAGFVSALRGSLWGERMLAVRSNERSAASIGINVNQTKLIAFAVSAFIAGIAGALSAYRFGTVAPAYFGGIASAVFLAYAFVGGISSVSGAVVGGVMVTNGLFSTALDRWIGVSPAYSVLIGGLGLIVTVIANPDGVAGSAQASLRRVWPTRPTANANEDVSGIPVEVAT